MQKVFQRDVSETFWGKRIVVVNSSGEDLEVGTLEGPDKGKT